MLKDEFNNVSICKVKPPGWVGLKLDNAAQAIQSCDKQFHLSTIWLLKVYFLMSSLLRFLNNLPDCPLLLPLSNSKNKSILYQLYLFHHLLFYQLQILHFSTVQMNCTDKMS